MGAQMTVLDGYEATRQIRKPQSTVLNHDIPVIAMTANAMQRTRAERAESRWIHLLNFSSFQDRLLLPFILSEGNPFFITLKLMNS